MAVTTLTEVAKAGTTYAVTVTFYDENDDEVTPTAAKWTLKDSDGAVVNSRQDVNITPLATSVDILLTGLDLPAGNHALEELLLTVTSTYNSDIGSNLTCIQQVIIPVEAV